MFLKAKAEAYQAQCFDEKGNYTGFQCPIGYGNCPIKNGDGLEITDALNKIGGDIELHHKDGQRFSATGTTNPGQVTAMCEDCHALTHENDPSASRFSRANIFKTKK